MKDINVDELEIRLNNLFYQLYNRPNNKEEEILNNIDKDKKRYLELTGNNYFYRGERL